MAIQKITTEKIKAKEGNVELEITKDTEKNKEIYTKFDLSFEPTDGELKKLELTDKDAKNLIKLFEKLFSFKAPQHIPKSLPTPRQPNIQANPKIGGIGTSSEGDIKKMEMKSIKARKIGGRKNSSRVADKINNREDDNSIDDFFARNRRAGSGGNSVVDKINNMENY